MVERLRLAVPGLVLARECKIQGHLQIKSLVKLERRVCNPEKVQKENGSGRKKLSSALKFHAPHWLATQQVPRENPLFLLLDAPSLEEPVASNSSPNVNFLRNTF